MYLRSQFNRNPEYFISGVKKYLFKYGWDWLCCHWNHGRSFANLLMTPWDKVIKNENGKKTRWNFCLIPVFSDFPLFFPFPLFLCENLWCPFLFNSSLLFFLKHCLEMRLIAKVCGWLGVCGWIRTSEDWINRSSLDTNMMGRRGEEEKLEKKEEWNFTHGERRRNQKRAFLFVYQ